MLEWAHKLIGWRPSVQGIGDGACGAGASAASQRGGKRAGGYAAGMDVEAPGGAKLRTRGRFYARSPSLDNSPGGNL